MKKNKIYLIALTFLTLFISCNQESDKTSQNNIIKNDKILEKEFNLVNYQKTVYENYFVNATNNIEFSSLKPNSISEYTLKQSTSYNKEKVKITINTNEIENLQKVLKKDDPLVESIYGKYITFKIHSKSKGNLKSKSDNQEVGMYVPNLVEITSPKIQSQKELFPVCYFENFVIEWNADVNNKEGLVVIAEYFGNSAIPSESTYKHVLNTAFIENDNGKTILNKELFKDIPDLSFVHIVLLRGNVKIEEIEGELYKFVAESHVRLPIILSKDLTRLSK